MICEEKDDNQKIFNTGNWPKVMINIININFIPYITTEWLKLYEYNIPFTFIFDLTNMQAQLKDIKYAMVLSNFIKKIRKFRKVDKKYNLLQQSIIITKKGMGKMFIESVFNLTKPLSTTYIVDSIELSDEIYNKILNNEKFDYKNVKKIDP
tara:strand:+ start:176 stop:631 length:456 start_codon:yes stop_codon:yes gene_type:complete